MSVDLKFDLKHPVQTNFLGNNAVYHGYAGMPDSDGRVYSEELCELEADRAATLGVRVVRTFYKWYAWDGEKWDWDNEECRAFYRWLDRMKKRGIQVSLNTGWWSPGDVNSTSCSGKSPFEVPGNWEKSVENYAAWVSETLHQLVELRGFTNVTYLNLFTEPQRMAGKPTYEGQTAFEIWRDCAKAVHERLLADHRRHLVKLIGPNEGSTSTSVMNRWVAQNADQYIDIYSSHNYQDFVVNEEESESNMTLRAVMEYAGARMEQQVLLKPHTDYTFSAVVEPLVSDWMAVSGSVLMGAWNAEQHNKFSMITAGGEPTVRLNQASIKMFDPAFMKAEPQEITCTFHSGDADRCRIGIFSDIKNKDCRLAVYRCALTEAGKDENLLHSSDFSKIPGYAMHGPVDPIEMCDDGWRSIGVSVKCHNDPYYFFNECVKTSLHFIPENKPFWFDEYNVRSERDRYDAPVHGTHLAANMQALMNAGVQSSLMWTLFDQQWPNNHANNNDCFVDGDHRYGVMPVLTRSLKPHPAFYAVGMVMKFMGGDEGTCIYAAEGEHMLHGTLSKMPDGNISVLVVNNKSKAEDFTVDLGETLGLTLNRYLYDPETVVPDERAELLPFDRRMEVGSTISDRLPANSLAVYTTY